MRLKIGSIKASGSLKYPARRSSLLDKLPTDMVLGDSARTRGMRSFEPRRLRRWKIRMSVDISPVSCPPPVLLSSWARPVVAGGAGGPVLMPAV